MNAEAYDGLLAMVDDTLGLAETAVKHAEAVAKTLPQATREPVTLVKVAGEAVADPTRFGRVADALMKTGAFREFAKRDLEKFLKEAGYAGYLELLEKLASRAVFPLDAVERIDGDLVESSASTRTEGQTHESKTELWERCCTEAGLLQGRN